MRDLLSHFVILTLFALASFDAGADSVHVIVRFEDDALRFVESASLKAPLHHAGYYVRWTNEKEFLSGHKLIPHATYQVDARVLRTEVGQFPEGWRERSGKYFTTFFLEAISIKTVGAK